MLNADHVTKIVRRYLQNPNLKVENWVHEQNGLNDNDMPVYRIQGYVTDPIAYYLEGTPIPFDIRFSLSSDGQIVQPT